MLFSQEQLAHLRGNTNRAPHLQTTSKQVCTWYIISQLPPFKPLLYIVYG